MPGSAETTTSESALRPMTGERRFRTVGEHPATVLETTASKGEP